MNDREMVARVLAGDRAAFRELVHTHQRLVSHVVFRIVRDPRDREEVCQDVFIRVYQKLDQFAHESALGTWIARIAYRLSLNHLERRRIPLYDDLRADETGGTSVDQLPGTRASPLDEVEGTELRAFVRARVDELPVQYRTVVTLYHLEEMAVGEIAAVMDLPEGTVKSHLFRARRMLKEKLVASYGPGGT